MATGLGAECVYVDAGLRDHPFVYDRLMRVVMLLLSIPGRATANSDIISEKLAAFGFIRTPYPVTITKWE